MSKEEVPCGNERSGLNLKRAGAFMNTPALLRFKTEDHSELFLYTIFPSQIVYFTFPYNSHPVNGELEDLEA